MKEEERKNYIEIKCPKHQETIAFIPRWIEKPVEVECTKCFIKLAEAEGAEITI